MNWINKLGQIVGPCSSAAPATSNCQNGKLTTILYPGSYQTSVQGINDAGEIVGYYSHIPDSGNRGFVLDRATFTFFAPPTATSTYAYGIDGSVGVVGFALTLAVLIRLRGHPGPNARLARCLRIAAPGASSLQRRFVSLRAE